MTSTAFDDQFLPHPDDVPQASAEAIRNAALEEAASICDAVERDNDNGANTTVTDRSTAWQMNYCADRIRALKSTPAAQPAASAEPSMKLVPLKPTLDMALAAEDASMMCGLLAESNQLPPEAYEWPTQRIWHCVRVYEAMIAAAPVTMKGGSNG